VSEKEIQIEEIVTYFSNYDDHLTHSRPLVFSKIKDFGLNVALAEADLKDLLWEVYIMLNGFFSMTQFVKLFENQFGVSWGRNFAVSLPQLTPPQQQNVSEANPVIS